MPGNNMKGKDREEVLQEIISEYCDKHDGGKGKEKTGKGSPENERASLSKKIIFIVLCLIAIAITGRLVIDVIGKVGSALFKEPQYLAVGKRYGDDEGINRCVANLWKIRKAADLYRGDKKVFPSSMEDLYAGSYISRKVVCPVCGEPYIFKSKDGRIVFCCPEPGRHDVAELYGDLKSSSMPVIERER